MSTTSDCFESVCFFSCIVSITSFGLVREFFLVDADAVCDIFMEERGGMAKESLS